MYTPNYIIFFCTVSPRSWEDTNVSYFFIKLYWDFKKIRVEFYEKKKKGKTAARVGWVQDGSIDARTLSYGWLSADTDVRDKVIMHMKDICKFPRTLQHKLWLHTQQHAHANFEIQNYKPILLCTFYYIYWFTYWVIIYAKTTISRVPKYFQYIQLRDPRFWTCHHQKKLQT